jgi:tetratricopeptide (TPR) repeat protein
MKRKLDALKDDLSWFVDQREHFMLVLDCTDMEVAYVFKVFQIVEGEHVGDVFMLFANEATDADGYVGAIVENVEVQIAGANALRAEDGLEPWPALPEMCRDRRYPASDRLKAVITYLKARLPEGDHHLVVALLPTKMTDRAGYASAIQGLIPRHGLQPWMPNVRVLVRDDRNRPFLIPNLQRETLDLLLFYDRLDLSTDAMTQALVDDAIDPAVPEPERMAAMVQLAALDYSYRRYDQAYAKWSLLFGYYQRMQQPPMQALALNGAADVLRAVGKLPEAKVKYQQGLALAQSLEALPIALVLLMGIGEVCLRLNQWVEAEGYLNLADQIATKTLQTTAKCDILERHGIALRALGRVADAQKKWRACVDLSREFQHHERAESVLGHLIALFREAQMRDEVRKHEQELELVRREHQLRDHSREAAR